MQLPLNNLDTVDVDRESRVREIIPLSQRLPPCRLRFASNNNRNEGSVCISPADVGSSGGMDSNACIKSAQEVGRNPVQGHGRGAGNLGRNPVQSLRIVVNR